MKKQLFKVSLSALMVTMSASAAFGENITIKGIDYPADVKIERDLGPGIKYTRLRFDTYPLNVNMVRVDLNNPYNRIETMQGQEQAGKTESLVSAAKRYTTPGHQAVAGANGNFWCVSGQPPWSDLLVGVTFGGNVRNGKIITETNAYADQWCYGPTGEVIAIDEDKNTYCEPMLWRGYIRNDKIGIPEIIQVNKVVRDGEIALYNSYYGTSKAFQPVNITVDGSNKQHYEIVDGVTTEVYLDMDPGQRWQVLDDMEFTVAEVRTNAGRGTLGSHDAAILGRGDKAALLAQLAPGDKLVIAHGWLSSVTNTFPRIDNLIQGLAVVMKDGVKIDKYNYDSYNGTIYPRTCYGVSSDGKTLYMFVVDKSTDPVWGVSKGCDTEVVCDIAMHYGCVSLVAMDGGGSTQMFIEDRVVNKTTESTPRAVANGFMAFNIAPEDDEITRLEYDEYQIQVPAYAKSRPVILGYNKYGALIDHDVQGVEFSCDAALGKCVDGYFIAGGTTMTGDLTARYGDVTVTKPVTVVAGDVTIALKPIFIDSAHEYPIEVCATIGGKTYSYDPADIEWTVDDESVCKVDGGVLKGLANGKTTITGKIGSYTDCTDVVVEISPAAQIAMNDWSDWTPKVPSGITNATLSGNGELTFTYGAPRDAYVQLTKTMRFYSIPDKIELTFTPSVDIEYVGIDLRTRYNDRTNLVKVSADAAYAANITHTVEIPVSEVGDPAYLGTYPLDAYYLRFQIRKDSSYKGEQNIKVGALTAHYSAFADGIDDIVADYSHNAICVYPNPVAPGQAVTVAGNADSVEVYTLSGVRVARASGSVVEAPSSKGIYIVKASVQGSIRTAKLIVK